jgi:hypothetical protein
MAANKTVETDASVKAVIDVLSDERQRSDAREIAALMGRLSGYPAKLWGPSIIGFGSYHYRYESGREGDMCRIGFSLRKGKTVLYIVDGFSDYDSILARLGKHKTGKSCLYIKHLSDLDKGALTELITGSLKAMDAKYPQ